MTPLPYTSTGAGIAFYFRPLNAAISEVPVAEAELSMLFGARTIDFQEVSVQATVTYSDYVAAGVTGNRHKKPRALPTAVGSFISTR